MAALMRPPTVSRFLRCCRGTRGFSLQPRRGIQFLNPLDPPEDLSANDSRELFKSVEDVQKNGLEKREPSAYVPTIEIGKVTISKLLLRDACTCPKCVDPSSTQKNYQTTQIPENIDVKSVSGTSEGKIQVTWDNDIAELGTDHVSEYPSRLFHQNTRILEDVCDPHKIISNSEVAWNAKMMKDKLKFVDFDAYMTNDDSLYEVLEHLHLYGLVFLKNVPSSLKDAAVEDIATRIGRIRDTFYGRTWDVRSVPDAKNVAYTSRYLGLHMDLLYMANPPGYQFLHCMENTAQGGASIFSDTKWAASHLKPASRYLLHALQIPYEYRNNGEHYFHNHPVLYRKSSVKHVNYSPPFQAPFLLHPQYADEQWHQKIAALREFSAAVEDPENVVEYRLQEGECVIFNNRRVLHGRKEFDALGGKRHYKGTYIDTDVVSSRYRVLKQLDEEKHPDRVATQLKEMK
ncbi:Clavaminate synthase-like protein [Glarea lozoyensis ATCC 20868]|uniref:Clavaminate synthase-like protein n=1 Tax=Glarea lozoyensis (strain ATCC 20868 / MF5171) TaxID=1116229 RepID=S3CN59_GLAL2|nr:Clavaminate synthase-like protein [Glarea lozoyensis ATCC 20868]EPE27160.1 Clavaminate synthase-like protein [Glarea lozoyensis ATCC 20868]